MNRIWRHARTIPPISSIILWLRRRRKEPRVNRVLKTLRQVEQHYKLDVSKQRAHPNLTTIKQGRVLAQPVAVVGPDWALLWAFSPQLQRRPATCSTFWKASPPAHHLTGHVLFAAVDGFSYYHWLLGTIPKLCLAMHTDRFDHYIVNPRHKGRDQFQIESLHLLDLPIEKVRWIDRGKHFQCDQLTLPSEPCTHDQTRLSPWAQRILRDTLLPKVGDLAIPKGPEKIYITRAQARRRRLSNETEVSQLLENFGFIPVVLESLPLTTQIKWLSEADSVVGLHGAGLANLVFCRPGTKVVEITSDVWPNPCFQNLAKLSQLPYARVVGRAERGIRADFVADVTVEIKSLNALMAALHR